MRLGGSLQEMINEGVAWMRQVGTKMVFVAGLFVLAAIGIALLLIFGAVALWIVVIYIALAAAIVLWRRVQNRFGWIKRGQQASDPNAASPYQRHDTGNVKTIDVVAEVTYVDEAKKE